MKNTLLILFLFFAGIASAQETFTDDVNGLSYTYPESWHKDQNSTGTYYVTNDTAYFLAQADRFFKDFEYDAQNINDSAYREDLLNKMILSTGRDVTILEYGNMNVSGLPAYFIVWNIAGKDNNPQTGSKMIQIQTAVKEMFYTFNAGAPIKFYTDYKSIFDSIIASISIKKR